MARARKERIFFADLHDTTEIHHSDSCGDVFHHCQVVCDEQIRNAKLLLQVLQQIDHLRLHRHVERGNRLVTHDQLWLRRQGSRDANTLPLTAGKLMWITLRVFRRKAHCVQQFGNPFALASGMKAMQHQRFAQRLANGHARV